MSLPFSTVALLPVGGRRTDLPSDARLMPRLLLRAALCAVIVIFGGLATPIGAAASIAGMVLLLLDVVGTDPRPAPRLRGLWLRLAVLGPMAVAGGVLNQQTSGPGWVLLGVAVVRAVSELPIAAAGFVLLLAAVTQIGGGWRVADGPADLLWNSVGVGLMAVAGYGQRMARLRRASEHALVARSRELERRSQELIEQTVRTRAETARAAALEERNRIAGDLHDMLAHALGGLVVQLDVIDAVHTAGGDPDEVSKRLRTSRRLAVDGLRDARDAVRQLRSDGGDEADPVAAVRAVTAGPVGTELGVAYEVIGEPAAVPGQVAAALAAVAREAMSNVNKHARGARVSVSLIFDPPQIRLEVLNAIRTAGGSTESDELARSGAGVGIATMRGRMADVGGTLTAGPVGGDRWLVTADWAQEDGGRADDRRPDEI